MEAVSAHEQFFHIRVIIGVVTGLSVARLLSGLARFIQYPKTEPIYPVHLVWTAYLLIAVLHFWWFEFSLSLLPRWSFPAYVFVILYAALFYFISVVLYPDRFDDAGGFEGYFHARQGWFYGLLAALFLVDLADTALKGGDYLRALGPLYPVRQVALAGIALAAARIEDRRFHAVFAAAALVMEVVLIGGRYLWLA